MENVLLNKMKENDRVPSVRDLAISLEVNPNTVVSAYTYLHEKEILYNKRGIGYFIAEGSQKQTQQIRKKSFLNDQLPQVFKNMLLLDIDIIEIDKKYQEYKNESLPPKK